jgi:hypothetical protein
MYNPRRSPSCSTRCARAATRCSRSTPAGHDDSSAVARLRGPVQAGPEPIPIDEVEPAAEIVKRFQDRRDVSRLRSARGARESGHRDEPHRRQVEHREGGEDPVRFKPDPNGDCAAARSSRWRRDASV